MHGSGGTGHTSLISVYGLLLSCQSWASPMISTHSCSPNNSSVENLGTAMEEVIDTEENSKAC